MALCIWLALLGAFLRAGTWRPCYAVHFTTAWNNAVLIGLGPMVFGAVWLILGLFGGLFTLLGVDPVANVILSPRVFVLSQPIIGAAVLLNLRAHEGLLARARDLAFAPARLLIPVITAFTALLLATLPFTGIAPLRAQPLGTPGLLLVVALAVLLLNTAVPHRPDARPGVHDRVCCALVAMLPVLVGIALHGMAVRVLHYGLTPRRYLVLSGVLLAGLYAAAYVLAFVRGRGQGWRGMARANQRLAWPCLGVLLLLNAPVFHPNRAAAVERPAAAAPPASIPPR